jgi:cobalt-zinc-cadmium efflux system outer membrane protein
MLLLLAALVYAAEPPAPLDLAAYTREVLAVNPEAAVAEATLDRARATAEASGPWPDPMVDVSVAPGSLGGMVGWQVQARQDLPLWGTRRAARAMADADADAASARLGMMRLELADMAAMAWIDWYTVHRDLDLVAGVSAILTELHAAVLARMGLGRATELDALQIEAELGWLEAQTRALEAERDVVGARVNTLLHRDPAAELPAPPPSLDRPASPNEGGARPELAETAAMTRAAESEARMARADRLPMVGVMAGWDAMQAMPEDRLMAGLTVQVPLDQHARAATQDAADAGVRATEAEAARTRDQVALDIATAEHRYRGQVATLDTIERALLPVARARVAAARSGFAAGTADVRTLLEAERAALDTEIRREQATATLVLRAREVELAHGVPFPGGTP